MLLATAHISLYCSLLQLAAVQLQLPEQPRQLLAAELARLAPTFGRRFGRRSHQSTQSVYILGAQRTPIGAKDGSLASVSATDLGVTAVKAALSKAGVKPERVEEIYMGHVVQAGTGQSPARQVGIHAG